MSDKWNNDLTQLLIKTHGKKMGLDLSEKYAKAFSTSYREDYSTQYTSSDISEIEELNAKHPFNIQLYNSENFLHLRLFQLDKPIPLSDVLPIFENLDLKTLEEKPYRVTLSNKNIFISDFTVVYNHKKLLNIKAIKDIFEDAFTQINLGTIENDGFNKLVLGANLNARDIVIVRAYAKYLHQIGFRFSQGYIECTLADNANISCALIDYFKSKFNLKSNPKNTKQLEKKETAILTMLDSVKNLDEDKILRRFLDLIKATIRTNYFQKQNDDNPKEYVALKFSSRDIPDLPLPKPLYEIFVYSPRFEAIHLRNAKVARGGIRWSDRREDFRTEILGLMKAQVVKNAVIVPSGAKGGFVLKQLQANADRSAIQAEVINCYKAFMSGLLDITDNLKSGKVIHPTDVVCYDDDDPYLVVAADKGTASFSDIANNISKSYDFWLHDAFASGGSAGYDHKKMGITARGAWESIKRHFCELGFDIQTNDFTVVGIGDMSGDVFGNGMIYSKHIKLLAAFDHRDIFLDPNPDPTISYTERLRLFNLPTSSWQDYDTKLISKGGGVFSRTLKSIPLSSQIKAALNIEEDTLAPNELIRAILKAPVDLLYNGGIGTYVKAQFETQADVGDKTNEFCRINGGELRCKVVGEGGNLGFTQLGRIEYALNGGLINTDFIDNSAGVDCSDHEVNIKILLNKEMVKGKLTEGKRNKILFGMTQEISELILKDNYQQAFAVSFAKLKTSQHFTTLQNCINELEKHAHLVRAVEYIPDDKKILERKAAGLTFTRPELSVLLAYTKIYIQNELLKSNIVDDAYLGEIIYTAFPKSLIKNYANEMRHHDLRREIIATQLSNRLVNEMGIVFVETIKAETGATVSEIVRAHAVASEVFEIPLLQKLIEALDFKISLELQYELLHHLRKLVTISTRWFLRGNRLSGDLKNIVNHYATNIKSLEKVIPDLMAGMTKNYMEDLTAQFITAGLTEEFARRIAISRALYTSLNIIEVATNYKFDIFKTAAMYFHVGAHFNLVWFRDQIGNDAREGFWNNLARLTLRDQLDIVQRNLSVSILNHSKKEKDTQRSIEYWEKNNHRAFSRWEKLLEMLHSSTDIDYSMFFIALRELGSLLVEESICVQ